MQEQLSSVAAFGYSHSRRLKTTDRTPHSVPSTLALHQHPPEPLCVYYDLLVDDDIPESDSATHYEQFFSLLSDTPFDMHTRRTSLNPMPEKRRFVKNDERRSNLIAEFILTEDNYVMSLQTFINSIVHRVRAKTRDRHSLILGPYECNKIFMNIEQILQVNQSFLADLVRFQKESNPGNFGDMCLSHIRRFSTPYHKFLLGVENAQTFNIKEQKNNPTYQAFLDKVKSRQELGNQTMYDYLALPGQRVGRYTLFLKELIKHTTDDHPDLPGLSEALIAAEEIANMSEDYHTKLIRIFHNMLQSIQNCPASLISQQRCLICHLDAVELDTETLKPTHPVTFFLFSDKLMVVRRPSYTADGLELCGLDHERDKKTGMLSLLVRKGDNKRYDRKLKFRGWLNVSDIEICEGLQDIPTSFTLVANYSTSLSPDVDPQTRDALEGYFYDSAPRLFTLSTSAVDGSTARAEHTQAWLHERRKFIEQFGKAKMAQRTQQDDSVQHATRTWRGRHFFANVYPISTYPDAINKSDVALVYLENTEAQLRSMLSSCYMIPHMLGFVVPRAALPGKYVLKIQSKLALGCVAEDEPVSSSALELDIKNEKTFAERLFGNLYDCNRDLHEVGRMANSLSVGRKRAVNKSVRRTLRQEIRRRKSISTFKLFNIGATTSLSRSQSFSDGGLESRISHTYSSSSSASDLTLGSTDDLAERRKSSSSGHDVYDKAGSSYQPSIHPTQTVSYEIKPKLRRKSIPNSNETYEVQRKQLHVQKRRASRDNRNISTIDQPRKSVVISTAAGPSPSATTSNPNRPRSGSHGSSSGFSTMGSQTTVSTTYSSPFSQDLSLPAYEVPVDKKVAELLANIKNRSPALSESSTNSASSTEALTPNRHSPNGIEKLMAEMDQMKAEFHLKYSNMIRDYEEMGSVVRKLTRELRKKDEELSILRVKHQDTLTENDLLYEAFNNELDQLSAMYPQPAAVMDTVPVTRTSADRPRHPTPETQILRKLEVTIKERNQWHQTACKLARELQDLSTGLGVMLDAKRSSSTICSVTSTSSQNNDTAFPSSDLIDQ
ncbi:hypothetical protein BCR43DRAFT_481839 [Syncephalastrum racemosum]|uniref:DH domain-containing protein n=1 Tax=Syncephalastrum racemosum TaxID=13706 RepID=A0A1X2HU37_SYNRA|nr:hypothetical protein BCR43DRAFT_481839 [Syncephalastrum racemosum]